MVSLTAEDGQSGMSGGLASVEYSRDGGLTWHEGAEVIFRTWKRGGGSGEHELLYRATDAAGNTTPVPEATLVRIDARPPLTSDDAPLDPQTSDVTIHLTAADSLFGVSACSDIKETWYSLDGGDWALGTQVTVTVAGNAGLHWIAYYSVDNVGNAEYAKWCCVTITAPDLGRRAGRPHVRR